MKYLLLMRHANSESGTIDVSDHDRTLSDRGLAACARVGALLTPEPHAAEHVLCSSATRARQTLAAVAVDAGWDLRAGKPTVDYDRRLYVASCKQIIDAIRATDDDVSRLMVVAHYPGLGDAARLLAGQGDETHYTRLCESFPPAALARLEFSTGHWREGGPGGGVLTTFVA
ncbi:MAG: histidine phosphatase family protein [Planctomycetota bacterium]|nr:histidine phosphatase family protein [Planctomycetota bacterium]